jgi:hypothetical protein
MKNIFNDITENNLSSYQMFKTFYLFKDSNVNSPRNFNNFNQSNDDLYLTNRIKFLDKRMSLLKKRKQDLIYQLPVKPNLSLGKKKFT